MLTTNFTQFEITYESALNYFSPSAFAERKVEVKFDVIEPEYIKNKSNVIEITHDNKKYNIVKYEHDGNNGWLLKKCLSDTEQETYYKYLIDLSRDSEEIKNVLSEYDPQKAYPISYYNNVYTGTSNTSVRPDLMLDYTQNLWKILNDNAELLEFEKNDNYVFDSMYCQLFSEQGLMARHCDQYVSYGASISIGASCKFGFGSHTIILNSGDVFVCDFSKVPHEVKEIIPNSMPGWFSEENNAKKYTFDKARASIQIRNISNCDKDRPLISVDEFKKLISY